MQDMSKIKAIMCDVDGTLLTDNGVVSPDTIEAIKAVRAKGYLFGLCTGRDVDSVKTLLTPWGIEGLVDIIVGGGGAEIYDYILGIDTANFPLDGNIIKEIMKHYEGMDLNFAIPFEGSLYAPKDDRHIQVVAKFDGVPYVVADFDEFLKTPRAKCMIMCDPEYLDTVIERSKTFSNEKYQCACLKTASVLFEYMDPRISKTNGLIDALAAHDLTLDNLCTFGDADNDAIMTKNAAVGVVMDNGSDLTKSYADFICEDNNHDGIARFIEKYFS